MPSDLIAQWLRYLGRVVLYSADIPQSKNREAASFLELTFGLCAAGMGTFLLASIMLTPTFDKQVTRVILQLLTDIWDKPGPWKGDTRILIAIVLWTMIPSLVVGTVWLLANTYVLAVIAGRILRLRMVNFWLWLSIVVLPCILTYPIYVRAGSESKVSIIFLAGVTWCPAVFMGPTDVLRRGRILPDSTTRQGHRLQNS